MGVTLIVNRFFIFKKIITRRQQDLNMSLSIIIDEQQVFDKII